MLLHKLYEKEVLTEDHEEKEIYNTFLTSGLDNPDC